MRIRDLSVLWSYYQTGIYDEATRQLPILVDGKLLEISPGFFVEMPFLGFSPDGSFAVAGYQIDHQVRYFSAAGELLGTARQEPQTFYKDWNHHLEIGLDGAVYQLLSIGLTPCKSFVELLKKHPRSKPYLLRPFSRTPAV
jgi:hypothetical protein